MKKWLLALAASIALLLCLTGAALAEDPKLPTDKEGPSTVYAICPNCRSGDLQTTSNWFRDADTHSYEMQCSNCRSRWRTSGPYSHTWKYVEAKDPICTKIGWNAHRKCTRAGCDYKEGYVEIPTRGRHK